MAQGLGLAVRSRTVVLVGLVVAGLALLRMYPWAFVFEEPEIRGLATAGDPLTYLLTPQGGYLQVLGRSAFLLPDPFLTRIFAAVVIGLVAAYLARTSWLAAVALPFIPTGYPDGFVGPLNDQWWLAILVVLIALEAPRRWHYPVIALAGLSGLAPLLAIPVFRDRRGIVLLAAAGVQAVAFLGSGERHPGGLVLAPSYLILGAVLLAVLVTGRLPVRTRLAFAYIGLAMLLFASIMAGGIAAGSDRYLTVPWVAIFVGCASLLAVRHDDNDPVAALATALGARLGPAATTTATGEAARATEP